MLAKLIAFFNPKPYVEPTFKPSRAAPGYKLPPADPRWVSTIEQPQPNITFLVINKYKGWATETRHGEDSFEFEDTDVCWCYQHEFNRFIPDFLREGVNEVKGGVFSSIVDDETKSGGQDNCDAGVADNDDAETMARIKELAESNRIVNHNDMMAAINVKVDRYNRKDVQADWDMALYIDELVTQRDMYGAAHKRVRLNHVALKRYTRELVDAHSLSVTTPCKHTHDKLNEQARRFGNGDWLIDRGRTKTAD